MAGPRPVRVVRDDLQASGTEAPEPQDWSTRRGARAATVITKLLDSAPKRRDLGEALLELKLSPPQLRPGGISRRQLIETARSIDCRVVGVMAPAGYGKSTFLAEWARVEERRVAWVSLDRFDDDPSSLVAVLASAYMRIDPGRPDLVDEVEAFGSGVLGRAAPRLAAAFGTSPAPFVLMLDDLHELQSPACHDVLGLVLARVPPGSQVVAASRSEQPHLARLRVSGDAMEFVADDLAFDAAGAQQVFAGEHVVLSAQQAADLAERTEGWPAGLYLAAVVAKERGGEVAVVAGDDRYFSDYLYSESLARQPEDIQRFLCRTAVLEQLCGPLCDTVLQSSSSAENLCRIEASNLFLVPLDRRREWYRYHALYREFLLGQLRRTEADLIEKLHLRAADWFESNGSPELAVEQLLHTAERARAVDLFSRVGMRNYETGRQRTVMRWRAALGDATIEEFPALAIGAAWAGVLTGDTETAERWASFLDAASFDPPTVRNYGSFDSARAGLRAAMCAYGPEVMMADAVFAVSEEPVDGRGRPDAVVMVAEAHLLSGDVERARASFTEAWAAGARLGCSADVPLPQAELALLAMDRSNWQEAADHLDLAFTAIDEVRIQDYLVSTLAYVGAARLSVHHGDRERTERELGRAMRGRPMATYVLPWLAVRLRLQLAKVYLAMAEPTPARHLLREIDDILVQRPALGVLVDQVEEFRRAVTAGPSGPTGASPLTPAELRLLPYLQTHLTLGVIAERLFVSRNTVSSQVTSIHRKLDASSRREAVEKATALGLLGG